MLASLENDVFPILGSTPISDIRAPVPDEAAGGKGFTSNLLMLFISMRDPLTTGVTNQSNNSAAAAFMYHNMAPKLAAHGLMENEKIAGVRYRRSFVSKRGLELLAYYDRTKARAKHAAVEIEQETDVKV
ncbi:hypothetical protein [Cupriavidus sp. RAF12]|uniref:hypothetical protein n=1 Tax=Cupriavidus sp. RAF12 TaxID=3233050 RepID=UPI003F91FA16